MCFQGFIYYSCGHHGLEESECEEARSLEMPFFIKLHCPQYRTQRCRTQRSCGTGGYYCKQTRDGPFLDHVHEKHTRAKEELTRLNARLVKLQNTEGQFDKSADENNVSMEARRLHPAFRKLGATHQQLVKDRNHSNALMAQSAKIISHAMEWYRQRGPAAANGAGGATFEEYARRTMMQGRPQGSLNVPTTAHGLDNGFQYVPHNSTVTANFIDVSAGYVHPSDQSCYPGSYGQLDLPGAYMAATQRNRVDSGVPLLDYASMTNTPSTFNAPKKRGRPYKRTIEQTTAPPQKVAGRLAPPKKAFEREESPAVRRSTRVRGKKVSYAESDASEREWREDSPSKSDGSGFSPSKSESASPDKSDVSGSRGVRREKNELDGSKARRGGNSLRNLIGDWQKRSGAGNNATKYNRPMSQDSSYEGTMKRVDRLQPRDANGIGAAITPSLSQLMNQVQPTQMNTGPTVSTGANGRPPTRHGPPTQHSFGPCGNMVMQQQQQLPAATPNFFPPTNMPVGQTNLFNIYANGGMQNGVNAGDLSSSCYQPGEALNMPPSFPPAPVNRNWLINTPAFNIQARQPARTDHSPELRELIVNHDSRSGEGVVSAVLPHTPANGSAMQSDTYDRLRRSFSGSVPDFSTASNMQMTTPASTDPRKRKIAASSPALPSNKRMRLSLPGEDSTSNVYNNDLPYDHTGSVSSPSKMPTQNDIDAPRESIEDVQPMPAPKLVPTAVMYVPADDAEAEAVSQPAMVQSKEQKRAEEVGELPEQQLEVDEGVDAFGNPFSSDIDWGLFDDAFGGEG